MIEKDPNYWINPGFFIKYKDRFDLRKLARDRSLKHAVVNERTVEIPFTIKSIASLNEKSWILDLGCSESILPLQLAPLGFNVVGLDMRMYPYQADNFHFVNGDILNLPFKENSFDAVCCISTIEHIGIGFYNDSLSDDKADVAAVKQIKKVLKPNGHLILTVPFGKYLVTKQQRIYDMDRLSELFLGLTIKDIRYFIKEDSKIYKSNYWRRVSQAEISNADFSEDWTRSVCCVHLVKDDF